MSKSNSKPKKNKPNPSKNKNRKNNKGRSGKPSKGKSSHNSGASKNDEAFGQTREERWLKKFEAAAPALRYEMTLEMLGQTPLLIRGDDLLYVVSALNEILLYYNRLADLKKLEEAIATASKKEVKNVSPVFDIGRLNMALYQGQEPEVQAILDGWEGVPRDFMGPLALTLESVFHYGFKAAAESTAGYFYHSLAQRKHQHEEMRYQCGDYCISALLQSKAAGELSAEQFSEALIDFEVNAEEVPRILSQLELSADEHLQTFEDQLSEFPDHILSHLQFPFSEYMASRGMPFYTSGEIMTTVFSFWFFDEDKVPGSLAELLKLDTDALNEYLGMVQEAYPDTHLPYLLLWGLSLVYDWLRHLNRLDDAQYATNLAALQEVRKSFLEDQSAWTFSYILHWPVAKDDELSHEQVHFERAFATVAELPKTVEANERFEMSVSALHPDDQAALVEELGLVKAQYGDKGLESYAKDLEKELGPEIVAQLLELI